MVLSDNSKGNLGWKKWFITCWAMMENILFSGMLYGWGSLSFVLKMEHIYSDLCEDPILVQQHNNTTVVSPVMTTSTTVNASSTRGLDTRDEHVESCKPQDENMALCFTITAAMFGTGSMVYGSLSQWFGVRVTRLIAFVMFESGCLMMVFVSPELPWLMFPGFALISMAGLSVMMTNFQVSYLFTAGNATVVGLLSGAFDTSSCIMFLLKIAHEHGIMRQTTFILIAVVHVAVLISSIFFLPKYFIVSAISVADGDTSITTHDKKPRTSVSDIKSSKGIPSLKSCLIHPHFLASLFWMSFLNLRFQYFIGTINQYLNRLLHTNNEVSYFTDVCYYIMLSGIVGSFVTGAVFDWQKRKCKDGIAPLFRELMPSVLPLALTSLFATLLSILVLIPMVELLYPSFIMMTIYRAFLYSTAAAFIRNTFPSQHFGFLYGAMHFVAAIFGLLQYAFFTWSEMYYGSHYNADICLLCLTLLRLFILYTVGFQAGKTRNGVGIKTKYESQKLKWPPLEMMFILIDRSTSSCFLDKQEINSSFVNGATVLSKNECSY